jgi:hypothetical protein
VKLTIDQVEGTNAGLAEFEVYNRSVNIAPLSRVSVSSQNYWTGQFGSKAVDGVIAGFPGDYNKEWATQNQTVNSWIRLDWAQPYTINKVVLYDRPNTGDRITSALLSFSDGSSLLVDSLPNDGSPKSVTFAQKNVSWVKLSILAAAGTSTGLAEFEAFGYPATNNPYKNIAPLARVGVSSEKSPAASNSGWKAIDGVKSGFPSDINYEWSSAGELANAWIRLDWTRDYNVDTVVFYDKPNFDDQIHGALLYLSDGSVVIIDALPNDGTGKVFTFPSKRVNWAKLQIIYATGVNIGLSEWEVFGSPVSE